MPSRSDIRRDNELFPEQLVPITTTRRRSYPDPQEGRLAGRLGRVSVYFVSAGGPQELGVKLIEGRWFGPEDEGQPYQAVLINRQFRDEVFGPDESPLGVNIYHPDRVDDEEELAEESLVVGVIEDFRQRGEFFQHVPYALGMYREDEPEIRANFLFVKVALGTPAAFEEKVLETVHSLAPSYPAIP